MAEPASTLAADSGNPAGTRRSTNAADAPSSAGSVGVVETQYVDLPAPVRLDCGRELDQVRVAYETYGALSAQRDNVILVCHALSGDAHAAGFAKTPPEESTRDGFGASDRDGTSGKGLGWWDGMIGPGKAFDTDHYFVVSTNLLGGCRGTTGPSSTDPATGRPYGPDFPVITVADMVRTQRAFLDELGIERLAAVAGGSLGGMQALEWAILFPDQVDAVVAIASTHALHPQGVAWNSIARDAIMRDPDWQGGRYYGTGRRPDAGMGIARMVGHVTYLSGQALEGKFGRHLQPPPGGTTPRTPRDSSDIRYTLTEPEFQVESYLRHQADSFVKRFDANTYLYTSRALTYFDLARQHGGSLSMALNDIRARTLLIAFSSDWLYPPSGSAELADALRALGKPVDLRVIDAPYGHDCFLLEEARQTPIIRGFLEPGPGSRLVNGGLIDQQARGSPRVRLRDAATARRAAPRPEYRRAGGADLPDDQLCVRGP
jgi:homoserine O-acetyltransferase